MLRKLSLAAIGCLALLAASLPASAVAADPGCNGNNLPFGVYDADLNPGEFDITTTPSTKGAIAAVNGTAILCGTNPAGNSFFTSGTITYPNVPLSQAPAARCAASTSVVARVYCQNKGGFPLADHRYTGSATSDVYCDEPDLICPFVGNNGQLDNVVSTTTVRYDTGLRNNGTNHCLNQGNYAIVACFETEADISGYSCDADAIISVNKTSVNHELKMDIYQPTCETQFFVTPIVYFDTIDDLSICQYAGAVDGASCGTNPADWLNKNGTVSTATFTLVAHTTNLGDAAATATVNWT